MIRLTLRGVAGPGRRASSSGSYGYGRAPVIWPPAAAIRLYSSGSPFLPAATPKGKLLDEVDDTARTASKPSGSCKVEEPATSTPSELSVKSHFGSETPPFLTIHNQTYPTDHGCFNIPQNVHRLMSRSLHLQQDHPLSITRLIIESHFPAPTFKYYNEHSPVVSTRQNFDSLGFPAQHPNRSRGDTYYLNRTTVLRTHTSAHQIDLFRVNASDGYLITGDVYRRDEVDRSHYPIFHQTEGTRTWSRARVPDGDVAAVVCKDLDSLPKHGIEIEDPNPPFHPTRNPRQEDVHSAAEVEAIGSHLKRSLENMVSDIFTRARAAAFRVKGDLEDELLRMRWVEAFFPFTSPSWELEVYFDGAWLEVLGCGVVKYSLYEQAGWPCQLGWAFGLGLDRLAMVLFGVPDIRLFWSVDERFLSQFRGVAAQLDSLQRFVPFSKHPPCPKDVSFWLPEASPWDSGRANDEGCRLSVEDVAEAARSAAGETVEAVKLLDEFVHPKTGRRSKTFRIVYRSLETTLTHAAAVKLHRAVTKTLVKDFGVVLR